MYKEDMNKTQFANLVLGCSYKHLAMVLSGKAGFGEGMARKIAAITRSDILMWIWKVKDPVHIDFYSEQRRDALNKYLEGRK
jgi:hypothetical protein